MAMAAGVLISETVQASATPKLLRYRSGIQYRPQTDAEMRTAAEAKLLEGLCKFIVLFSKLVMDSSRFFSTLEKFKLGGVSQILDTKKPQPEGCGFDFFSFGGD